MTSRARGIYNFYLTSRIPFIGVEEKISSRVFTVDQSSSYGQDSRLTVTVGNNKQAYTWAEEKLSWENMPFHEERERFGKLDWRHDLFDDSDELSIRYM